MKRIVSLVLTMMLVFSCVTPVAFAGATATITATETVNRGGDVTVTYTLPDSVTDVIYLMLDIKFDAAVFEYKSAAATGWTVIPTSAGVCFVYETAKMEGGDDLSGQTVTAVLTCKADAEGGNHTITASVRADESYGETVDEIVIDDVNDTVNVYVPHEHEKGTHTPADEPSCWEAGTVEYWTCTGCDAKLDADGEVIADITVPATGNHVYSENYTTEDGKHWKACTTDGCSAKSEEANCSGGEANCMEQATCATCKVKYGTVNENVHKGGDSMTNDETHHWGVCACGDPLEKTAHTFEWVIDKEANVFETGLKHEKCTGCTRVRNEGTVIDKVVPAAPKAQATIVDSDELTFAMNFKTSQPADAQDKQFELDYYGDWEADFYLTINKDVTFNADNTKDGYLAGQYDSWSTEWVKVPLTDVSLVANQRFGIMQYAASLVDGFGGVHYSDVVNTVQEFDCGVYFTPEFLIANPDLEVTLELVLSKDGEEDLIITETEPFTYTAPALPTATVTEETVEDLTFALNFAADEASAEQLAYYGNWIADFVLTVNKDVTFEADNEEADGYLSGNYGSYGWIDVPFDPVTVNADETVSIMQVLSNVAGTPDATITYKNVYDVVQNFKCGVFFSEEFLAANPDVEATLELIIINPVTDEPTTIGDAYVFTVEVEEEEEPDPVKPSRPSSRPEQPSQPTQPDEEEVADTTVVVTKPEVAEAEEEQAPVQLDMTPVNPNSLFGGTSTINIKLPVDAGKVPVEIPVEDVTPGTVVVIVHEDGTEEVISTSVITEAGIVVELEGDVVVKVVDKSLYFSDVHGVEHWATKSIDFVSARGMFNGTSATTFSPENLTTRGQLMTVLARLSGADAPTIADGIEWAVENGISDGSNPDGYITRQDVAVMLWRYAGNIVSAYDISAYADAADVASYAKVAMAWAVENGIVTGYPDGTLLPQANATRAHVATMMERLVNYIA